MGNLSFGNKALAAMFESVTLRTAGFQTIPQENFKEATTMLALLWMFIGGSPSGTAGGVKTVTMAVLVNGNTSGAAELFACDLRDFGTAQLIGTKTAGNGTMQKVFELSDGSAVALTVAKIIPYKSESFNGTGLEPDHNVELAAEQNSRLPMITLAEDPQYQKALDLVSN